MGRHPPWNSPNGFDPENLLQAARKQSGLHGLGDDEGAMREALEKLTHSLKAEAALSSIGQIIAKKHLIDLLVSRLRVHATRSQTGSPRVKIQPPLIITGLPRSGSSFLQALLSQDPGSRAPQVWETMTPTLPRNEKERRRAITAAENQLRRFHWLLPDLRSMHELEAEMPQECIALMGLSFASPVFSDLYWVPSYRQWLDQHPLHSAYSWHQHYLEHLQGDAPPECWVLKAPEHLSRLNELLAVYPNAMIVQTHREPLQVLGSVANLTATLRKATSDRHDPLAIGKEIAGLSLDALEKGMAAREALGDEDRFFDAQFQDITQSPLETAERIYSHFGLPLTKAAKEAMRRFVEERPRNRRPRHNYQLDAFGLDPAQESPKFDAYRKRFGVVQDSETPDRAGCSPASSLQ